jgi:hypothetical protein
LIVTPYKQPNSLDSAHFGSHAMQVIAQALPGLKSFETTCIDIGNALLGSFSQNR